MYGQIFLLLFSRIFDNISLKFRQPAFFSTVKNAFNIDNKYSSLYSAHTKIYFIISLKKSTLTEISPALAS